MFGTASPEMAIDVESIRVLIVDDHALVRRGFRSLLTTFPDMEVVGEAADGTSVLSAAAALSPDIILLDIRLEQTDGLALVPQLRAVAPASRIVIVTARDRDGDIARAQASDIYAYVLKGGSETYLADTIRAAQRGERLRISKSMATEIPVVHNLRDSLKYVVWKLTDKQIKVLRLRAGGLTNKQIWRELQVTAHAIRYRLRNAAKRIGVDSPNQAVEEAIKWRMV